MKYILILFLFGFSSVSFAHDMGFAHDREKENWMTCYQRLIFSDKHSCYEINLNNVAALQYPTDTEDSDIGMIKVYLIRGWSEILCINRREGRHCN